MAKLYDEYYWKRKELQRLRSMYNKRVKRSKEQGLYNATYLPQISRSDLGYEKDRKTGKEQDLFPLEGFSEKDNYHQQQYVNQITRKIAYLQERLNNPMSSIRGVKNMIKQDLGLKKIDMNSKAVMTKLQSYQNNPEGSYKHAKIAQMMDIIDARSDLTDDEKKYIKKLIRERLSRREKVDYADWILEWDLDISELLADPKSMIDRLEEGIPEEVLSELLVEASKLETTDNPSEVGF